MATQGATFQSNGIQALLDQIYEIKFNKHVPLAVVILSTFYTVYRTQHYLTAEFELALVVSVPTAVFIELLVLGASAMVFIALRADFIAHITKLDTDLTRLNVIAMTITLGAAFIALLGLAAADAWMLTKDYAPAFVMTLVQATQMLFICGFIINATVDEREKIRRYFDEFERESKNNQANQCPYCFKPVLPNNRRRHMDACPNKP